jgi:hypothetical protein
LFSFFCAYFCQSPGCEPEGRVFQILQGFNARPFCHLLLLLVCLQSCQASSSVIPVLGSVPETEQTQALIAAYVPSPELDAFFRPLTESVYRSTFEQVKPKIESALATTKINQRDLAHYLLLPAVAIYDKDPTILSYLLQTQQVNVNQPAFDIYNNKLQHILLYPRTQDNVKALRYLLEHGADPEAVKTPLPTLKSVFSVSTRLKATEAFVENIQISQALLMALQKYPLENVALMVEHGAQIPEAQDVYAHIAKTDDIAKLDFVFANGLRMTQQTALSLLTYYLDEPRLSYLTSSGSDHEQLFRCSWFLQRSQLPLQTYVSSLPLTSALHYDFLKKHGFDINAAEVTGDPAYFIMLSKAPAHLIPVLYKDITNFRENQAGETLFDFAIKERLPLLSRLLIENQQTVHNIPEQDLLHLALMNMNLAGIRFFLDQGIKPDATTFSDFVFPDIKLINWIGGSSQTTIAYLRLLESVGYFKWLKSQQRADPLFTLFDTNNDFNVLQNLLSDPVYLFLMEQDFPLTQRNDQGLALVELASYDPQFFLGFVKNIDLKAVDLQALLRVVFSKIGQSLDKDPAHALQMLQLILESGGQLENFIKNDQPTWEIFMSLYRWNLRVDYMTFKQLFTLLMTHELSLETPDSSGLNFFESLEKAVDAEKKNGLQVARNFSLLDFQNFVKKYSQEADDEDNL